MKELLLLKTINRLSWLAMLLLTGCQISSTAQSPQPIKASPLKAVLLTTDKLRQVYIADANNDVIKLSPEGKELFRYSNKTLGQLGHIDVTDPFNVTLFYPDYLTIITLDRTMSFTGQYALWELGLIGSAAVGVSNDNQIWLYDTNDFKLKKIDAQGNTLLESDDLSMTLNQQITPTFILERNNWVYVNDPAVGILVFDNFGKYDRTIGIQTETFQIWEGQIVFVEKGQIQAFHLHSLLVAPLWAEVNLQEGDLVRVEKKRLYVARKDGGLEIHKK